MNETSSGMSLVNGLSNKLRAAILDDMTDVIAQVIVSDIEKLKNDEALQKQVVQSLKDQISVQKAKGFNLGSVSVSVCWSPERHAWLVTATALGLQQTVATPWFE